MVGFTAQEHATFMETPWLFTPVTCVSLPCASTTSAIDLANRLLLLWNVYFEDHQKKKKSY